MNYYPFNSRNSLYRSIIGAVKEGEKLKLSLLLHADALVSAAFLRVFEDNGMLREISMSPCGWQESYQIWSCEITFAEGLYWYDFRYESQYGEYFVSKHDSSLGIVSNTPGAAFQQTVYKADFTTPQWLKGGIIYQIFPDRFYNSGKIKKNVPQDRYICKDWNRQPEFRQNNGKCSLGNDYYGGDLKGVERKLPYLADLGVTCIYLNPIFEAHSNHRYNTANYDAIDPLLGSERDLKSLCALAKLYNIHIILDGVFSHTGDDSIYFNRNRRYGNGGAYNDFSSPYRSWYKFNRYPDSYKAWWGVPSLPETIEENESFLEYITGENGILRKYLRLGVSGWRLDVADELPDVFLDKIRLAIKQENPEAYILGEVWEDASNKISYGKRRKFLRGNQLDSVMNYPFSNAIWEFIKHGDAKCLIDTVLNIFENYPPESIHTLMNHIGTHDTARILTRLVCDDNPPSDREWQSQQKLSPEEYDSAVKRLMAAAVIQYTLPGVPSIYYGDEAGVEGFGDPFCRSTYPWGNENLELLNFYRKLGKTRRSCKAFAEGDFIPLCAEGNVLTFTRNLGKSSAFIAVNRGANETTVQLPEHFLTKTKLFGKQPNGNTVTLCEDEFCILTTKR